MNKITIITYSLHSRDNFLKLMITFFYFFYFQNLLEIANEKGVRSGHHPFGNMQVSGFATRIRIQHTVLKSGTRFRLSGLRILGNSVLEIGYFESGFYEHTYGCYTRKKTFSYEILFYSFRRIFS